MAFTQIELFAQIQALQENEVLLQNSLFELEGILRDQKEIQHQLEKKIKQLEKCLRNVLDKKRD